MSRRPHKKKKDRTKTWKKDHLSRKHEGNYFDWCILCVVKKKSNFTSETMEDGTLRITVSDDIKSGDAVG